MSRRGVSDDRRTVQERLLDYRQQRDARAARASSVRVIPDSDSSDEEESFVSARSEPDGGLASGGQERDLAQSSGDEGAVSSKHCTGAEAAAYPSAAAGAPEDSTATCAANAPRLRAAGATRAPDSDPFGLAGAIERLTLAPAERPSPGRMPTRSDAEALREPMPATPGKNPAAARSPGRQPEAPSPTAAASLTLPAKQGPCLPSGDGALVLGKFKLRWAKGLYARRGRSVAGRMCLPAGLQTPSHTPLPPPNLAQRGPGIEAVPAPA